MLIPRRARERVKAIDLGVGWSIGAPQPHLIQSELRTFLAFYLPDPQTDWDPTFVTIKDPTSAAPEPVGVIEWLSCAGAILGGPNDEAFEGHRLWSRGLAEVGAYSAAEVIGSSWIAALEKANRVHYGHRPEAFASLRHFILAFHDSTFECVAEGFRVWTAAAPLAGVLATLADYLDGSSDPPFVNLGPSHG